MTLDEFTTIIQYLQSPDLEIVELGRVLGKQMSLQIESGNNDDTWLRTTIGFARISYWIKVKSIEQIYAIAIW